MSTKPPVATITFVVLNLIGAIVLVLNPEVAVQSGFYPHAPSLFAAVVSMFLHFNLFHLLGNMLFLSSVGPAVERGTNFWKFAVIYLAGGLVGAYAHALMLGSSETSKPLIGASGAIAACVGYAGVRFFGTRVEFVPRLKLTVGFLVGLWVVLQGVGVVVRLGEPPELASGTAFYAHLGGFLTGVLMSFVFRASREAQADSSLALLDEMDNRSPAAVLAAAEVHLEKHPNEPKAILQKGRSLDKLGEKAEEAEHWAKHWKDLSGKAQEEAISRLALLGKLELITSKQRIWLAIENRTKNPDLAEALLLTMIEGSFPERPDALCELAMLRMATQPESAQSLAKVLVAEYPLHPATEAARARGLVR